jgi:hypothetical protein
VLDLAIREHTTSIDLEMTQKHGGIPMFLVVTSHRKSVVSSTPSMRGFTRLVCFLCGGRTQMVDHGPHGGIRASGTLDLHPAT